MSADKPKFFTAVYKLPADARVPNEITDHHYWSAGSWSHALDDRDAARATVTAQAAEIADLTQELAEAKAAPVQARGVLTDERAAFEQYIISDSATEEYSVLILQKDASGAYPGTRIQGAWQAWQARALLAAQPASDARYEYLRRLNPRQFANLWELNIAGKGSFDDLVDAAIAALKEQS